MFAPYHSLKKNTLKISKIAKLLFLNETFPFLSCYYFLQERGAIDKLRASWYGKRSLVSCFVPSSCLDMCVHCNLPWCKDYWQGNYQSMMPRTNPFTEKHSGIINGLDPVADPAVLPGGVTTGFFCNFERQNSNFWSFWVLNFKSLDRFWQTRPCWKALDEYYNLV